MKKRNVLIALGLSTALVMSQGAADRHLQRRHVKQPREERDQEQEKLLRIYSQSR